ncbi:MAG: hypothetical protein N2C12_13650 [Planctomycetales bacterium]
MKGSSLVVLLVRSEIANLPEERSGEERSGDQFVREIFQSTHRGLNMPIRFACENCQELLTVSDQTAGQQMRCPKCTARLSVPNVSVPSVPVPNNDPQSVGQNRATEKPATPGSASPLVVYDTEFRYEDESVRTKPVDYDPRLVAISRKVIYLQAGLLVALTMGAALVGYMAGSTVHDPADAQTATRQRVLIQGEVKWVGFTGPLADSGAVVLVLPSRSLVEKKIAGGRLAPDRPLPASDDKTIEMIEDWGGYYTRTNTAGQFELFVRPGDYNVLVVSHRSKRRAGQRPSRDDIAELGEYVSAPLEIIGPYRYAWQHRRFDRDSQLSHEFAK